MTMKKIEIQANTQIQYVTTPVPGNFHSKPLSPEALAHINRTLRTTFTHATVHFDPRAQELGLSFNPLVTALCFEDHYGTCIIVG